MSVVVKYKESKPIRAIEIGPRLEIQAGGGGSCAVTFIATASVPALHCFAYLTDAELTRLIDALIDIRIATAAK